MTERARQTEVEFRNKCLFEAGLSYSMGTVFVLAVSFIFALIVGAAVQFPVNELGKPVYSDWYIYLAYLLPQVGIFLAVVIYFLRSKEPVRTAVSGCKWYYYPLAVLLMLGLLFPFNELNSVLTGWLVSAGYKSADMTMVNLQGWRLLPAIIVIAVVPAVMEETLFRGIMTRNMKESGWGTLATVLITGALFSIYHTNPVQTVYQFVAGAALAFVAVRAGSHLPTIVAHFVNNALLLILTAVFSPKYGIDFALTDIMPFGAYVAVLVISCLAAVGAICFLVFFRREAIPRGKPVSAGKFAFGAVAGIGVCVITWIVTLISGFVG